MRPFKAATPIFLIAKHLKTDHRCWQRIRLPKASELAAAAAAAVAAALERDQYSIRQSHHPE